ncbi:MAG: type I-C CRISPR-associated protein Cas8c/Csd1 [Acidobacteriota bacterium]
MLEALVRYATTRNLVAEPGFKPKEARWSIQIGSSGRYLGLQELGEAGPKNKGATFAQCADLTLGEMKRGGGGTRHFLLDQVDVIAHLADEPDAKLDAKHAFFISLLRQAAEVMPELGACAAALEDPEHLARLQDDLRTSKAKPTDKATFAVALPEGGFDFPVSSDAWHNWWRGFRRTLGRDGEGEASGKDGETAPTVRCLASGERVAPVATQFMIRGLADVGGLPTGDALASFKQESFCSYGFVQGENAPVSEEMASAFRAALEQLLVKSVRLGDLKIAYWFRDAVAPEEDLFGVYAEGEDLAPGGERLASKFLRAFETGERAGLAKNRFYALTLSGASGRIMVHDWIEGSFEDLARAQDCWFSALSIVRRDGLGLARDPKFLAVGGALVRVLGDLPRPLLVALWRSALRPGLPMPQQALAMALARFRIDVLDPDHPFNHARAGVLKACLLRAPAATRIEEEDLMPYLNAKHPAPAYHCGRLVALLAELQRRALGDVGAGVVQRFYAAACTTPALVLGRLLRTSQFHLDKLDVGLRRLLEGEIAEVVAEISDFPQTLDLPGQALFALGYYQQIAHDRAAAALRRADRAAAADGPTAPSSDRDDTETEIAS